MKRKRQSKEKLRNNYLLRTYGISEAKYQEILREQSGGCAICLRPSGSFKKRLAVDHNHRTGEIRGLLCTYCNKYLVGRHTDGDLVRRIADYVSRGLGLFVPDRRKKKNKKRLRKGRK